MEPLVIERTINRATPEKVWSALTDKDVKKWFMDNPEFKAEPGSNSRSRRAERT